MDSVFRAWERTSLVWLPEQGMGWYPTNGNAVYGQEYFDKYRGYARTGLGRVLTRLRLEMVDRHLSRDGLLVDVGIGCGQFVKARGPNTYGFDINPIAVRWLEERQLLLDPARTSVPAATFFDSLEHIKSPHAILRNVHKWIFCSLPIFDGPDHVLRSKHFRKDEHCWYWSREGFEHWMDAQGFEVIEENDHESHAGREDILSFALRRTP